jgi:phosphoribosylanthranilate isomerase
MRRVRVKICGITSREDLQSSVNAGADALGFVVDVPWSPRNLTSTKAKMLIDATPIFVDTVVVTVPKNVSQLEKIYNELTPDFMQIHGLRNKYWEIRDRLPDSRIIGAIQVKPNLTIDEAVEEANLFDAILLDSYVPNVYGGTGKTHNWKTSKEVREAIHPKPLILAGGLKPDNVTKAISIVKPYAVDVSTGVESSPGKKEEKKIVQFIKKVEEKWI